MDCTFQLYALWELQDEIRFHKYLEGRQRLSDSLQGWRIPKRNFGPRGTWLNENVPGGRPEDGSSGVRGVGNQETTESQRAADN